MGPLEFLKIADVAKRTYDYLESNGAPFHSDEFMAKHSEFLRASIDLVPGIDRLSATSIDEAIASVLTHLASIVKAYHSKDRVSVNANYMIPRVPTVELRDAAIFTRRDRDPGSFCCFLTLEKWADHSGACPRVVLPVDRIDSGDLLLFGAPTAFTYKRTELVPDTWNMSDVTYAYEAERTRQEIGQFFQSQRERLRSFVSFPVVAPAKVSHSCPYPVIAVVNIDANKKRLLGYHVANQRKLGLALEPVIHVLSHLLVRKHWAVGTITNNASSQG
jgi:hypothetical protein